jgi:methylenetetrahydrofolate reductase (NADPH)
VSEHPQTRISVEIVPRDADSVRSDMAVIAEHLPAVDTINIPDLMKFELRSWDACGIACQHRTGAGTAYRAVPHIRAADLDPASALPMVAAIDAAGLEEILVVTGDAPIDFSRRTYDVDAVDAIERLRRDLPHVTVYAGLDPYRQSPVRELEYAERKLEAGAAGFFTQPFFDLHYMRAWSGLLPPGVPVWWGATTVTSAGSLTYWRKRNLAVFPAGFETTLEWHRSYAVGAVALARELGQHIYLMPVRASVHDYLAGIV